MRLIPVNNPNISELLIYQQLRDNAFTSDNSFIADSSKVVNLILESNIEVKSIFATQAYYDEFQELIQAKSIDRLYVSTKELMQTIVGHTSRLKLHLYTDIKETLKELKKQGYLTRGLRTLRPSYAHRDGREC